MRKAAINICIALILTITASTCFGGSITYSTNIKVSGGLKLTDSDLCFPDGTCQTTALTNDGSAIWGQITGLISNQTDLQNQLNLKEDKTNKGINSGYASLDSSGRLSFSQIGAANTVKLEVSTSGSTPVWQLQWPAWIEDTSWLPDNQPTAFIKNLSSSTVDIFWTDNVGTYDFSWCNVGIFLGDSVTPACFGSWTGNAGYILFQQRNLHCNVTLPAGVHNIAVKHRSQHCAYGNYPNSADSYGTQRQIIIREVN